MGRWFRQKVCSFNYIIQQLWINVGTVFIPINAAAFNYFASDFGAAFIRGRCLFEGSVYYFGAASGNFELRGGLEELRATLAKSSVRRQPAFSGTAEGDEEDEDPFDDLEEDEEKLEDNEMS